MLASPDNGIPVLKSKSARRRRVVMPLIIAVAVSILALALLGSGQQSQLIGSGSTLAHPLIENSAQTYRNALSADNPERPSQTGNDWVLDGSGIDYEPVGSLGGIMRLADPEVDFAVSDYPLSTEALAQANAGQFPIAIGSIAVVHNLELPQGQELRLDAATLAGIYQGTIKQWNDPALTALNPGVQLPAGPINAVHRSDGSGSTFGITRYLTAGSPDWANGPGAGSVIQWPAGVGTAAERSSGLITAVQSTLGSVGYVETGQALRAGLKVAALRGGAESFNTPSPETMRAALTDMDWSGEDNYVNLQPNTEAENAYPATVAIYSVIEKNPDFQKDTRRTLGYMTYLIEHYDASAQDLGYLPLPEEAATAVQDYWARTFTNNR